MSSTSSNDDSTLSLRNGTAEAASNGPKASSVPAEGYQQVSISVVINSMLCVTYPMSLLQMWVGNTMNCRIISYRRLEFTSDGQVAGFLILHVLRV